MKLVIAEKPSVAMSLAAVLGATERKDGYLEGSGYLVSWCVGHLLELAQPEAYKEQYEKQYQVFCKLLKASRKEVPLSEIIDCIERIVVDVDRKIMVKWTE